ncbi:MAG: DNA-formamidopyrimidine glycosylase family protein [Candidatus Binatia bacterium]|nr:DNA-formamidopyrimidine glycosylase family protein [Candidatus Binatia bacterium]
MPELPEVETVCRSLRPHLLGRTVTHVRVREPRLRVRVNERALKGLVGKRIEAITRTAKYVLLHFSENAVWVFHLGMTGKLICVEKSTAPRKHDHIVVALEGGTELRYHDPRRFGLSLVVQQDQLNSLPQLRHLGPDPLGRSSAAPICTRRHGPQRAASAICCWTSKWSRVWGIFMPMKFCSARASGRQRALGG